MLSPTWGVFSRDKTFCHVQDKILGQHNLWVIYCHTFVLLYS